MGRSDLNLLKKIGARVRDRIRAKGYRSVELFAHETGIPQSVLSRLIAGSRGVSLPTFIRIANALETSLDDLSAEASAILHKGGDKPGKLETGTGKHRKRKLTVDWKEYDRLEIRRQEGEDTLLIEFRRMEKKK
jgi:transcriptional regulator with XRE-family HTH domain